MKPLEQRFITIDIPTGYEINKTNSTFERIVFKPLTPVLPKRWEDLKTLQGFFITQDSNILETQKETIYKGAHDRNIWPTRELAEASIALAQLCQLRDVYNDSWVADWKNNQENKCAIWVTSDKITTGNYQTSNHLLAFKSASLCDQFFTNFKDLLEIAKPLL